LEGVREDRDSNKKGSFAWGQGVEEKHTWMGVVGKGVRRLRIVRGRGPGKSGSTGERHRKWLSRKNARGHEDGPGNSGTGHGKRADQEPGWGSRDCPASKGRRVKKKEGEGSGKMQAVKSTRINSPRTFRELRGV